PHERRNPDVINQSRRQRIAKGSGTSLQEVNKLIKQFMDTRQLMTKAAKMNPKKMMAMANQMKKMGMTPPR
ncbi:MAG: signal recognition particle protein, partial [Muribaculaceae bacterium]|nr:signal recognition particle protein [Muribaculaceae bacterium]